MRVAVIDLGTNTCNLLIAEIDSFGYKILHQSKQLVKLGDDKIRENEISEAATSRVLQSFQVHKKIISEYHADKVRVVATSAVRTAENKIEFLEQISGNSGWIVKLISGEKEAEMIFDGVLLAFNEFKNPAVILDIGGGSNELIVANNRQMLWKESQPTGMARIINQFKISDPILPGEINALKKHFAGAHKNAFEKCKAENVKTLVGCSGAFDTIADMIDGVNPGEKMRTTQEINPADFYTVYDTLINSTREQRLLMKGMDYVRVDLIVPAVILIELLISETGITQIIQTDFALREGVLFELMNSGTQTR
jgi:exopolyphosphatase/guanosine-5'-triphosphate,3'-diphosphate pyrophosphatase